MAENKTFEQSLKRIEEIVDILENGNLTLDESLALFEEATKLCAECNKKLENAKQKVINISSETNGDKNND